LLKDDCQSFAREVVRLLSDLFEARDILLIGTDNCRVDRVCVAGLKRCVKKSVKLDFVTMLASYPIAESSLTVRRQGACLI